jgi:hypothetical protein
LPGTYIGGVHAAQTNKKRYGESFYADIALKAQEAWDKNGRKPRGFASDAVGADGLTGKERASIAGAKGGRISRRTKAKVPCAVEDCPRFARTNGLCETHYQQLRRAQK